MRRGRLPLTALRSFETAGRHVSFSKAAEELFVSQAAISRQIRELEAFIGAPLFVRHHRRVELTENGVALLSQLTKSFDKIDQTLNALKERRSQSLVTISAEPSLASLWLLPRLEAFRQLRPDIDISVESDHRLVEFRNSPVELAIRHSLTATSWPRVEARRLVEASLTAMLSPALLKSSKLRSPAGLAENVLLHEENRDTWSRWFAAAGLTDMAPQRGPIFPDGAFAVNAARLGHGIALGDTALVGGDLRQGVLVRPFDVNIGFGAYWLVAPQFDALSEPAKAFVDWLESQFAAE